MFFFPPLDSAVGRFSLLPLPAFSSHSIHLILVLLYSFNKVLTFTNQQHYSTASGFLKKNFFLFTNQQHYHTASGFHKFLYNHSPEISARETFLADHKPSALPYSFWFFSFLREFYPRVFNTNFYSDHIPSALPYSCWFFDIFSFKYKPPVLSHGFGFLKHFITNHRHYHTASGFL